MSIHRFFRRQFPLKSRVRGIAFLCFILLMYGCGGEESVHTTRVESVVGERPINDVPISTPYYPMTLGNRWLYRNSDGSEWAREVTQSEIIAHDSYYSLTYNPPLAGEHPDFIKSPVYVVAPDGIFHKTKKNDINNTVWQTIEQSRRDFSGWPRGLKFNKGVWTTQRQHDDILVFLFYSQIRVIEHSDFALLHSPPDDAPHYTQRRKVLHMKLIGNENVTIQAVHQ